MTRPQIEILHLPDRVWRRREIEHDGILIHFISAVRKYPERPFDIGLIREILIEWKASCHYYIDRDGKIWEFVPVEFRAWHAGHSRFRGRSRLNNSFVGIELAGTDDSEFTAAQYESLARLVVYLMSRYSQISTSWIRGHEDVSDHTVRSDPKVDPGQYFDWIRLGIRVGQLLKEAA